MTKGKRIYVLDTNVLMHDPTALFKFEEHDVYLPMTVLEELDNAKKGMSEVSRNARQVSRFINELIEANGADKIAEGLKLIRPQGLQLKEAAQIGKERGATVIAITSETYSREAARGRTRLAEVADIVLDNGAPSGDATVPVPGSELKVGPVSTSIGAALINAVLAEAASRLQTSGKGAPIYLSANMPGAAENNAQLIKRYRHRNHHL